MISTKMDLKLCIEEEKNLYIENNYLKLLVCNEIRLKTYRYVKCLRKLEYYKQKAGVFYKFMYLLCRRKKNKLGERLGIEMEEGCFDKGLMIYHPGNIVVNGYSKIGKDCKLHGNNCIGNDGKSFDSPTLGNNVRLGVGAKVIGGITLADDITVAAGGVVVQSCNIPGAVLAGVPAKVVKIVGGGYITFPKTIRFPSKSDTNAYGRRLIVC